MESLKQLLARVPLGGTAAIAGAMFVVFTALFLVAVGIAGMNAASFEAMLEGARQNESARWIVFGIVVGVLTIDLFLPVPSTTVMVVAGYLLGPWWGVAAAGIGAFAAGVLGYEICLRGGGRFYRKLVTEKEEARFGALFAEWGALAMLASRAFPMAPEVLSCLAGMARMGRGVFYARLAIGTFPYALVCAVGGAMSSFQNPWPAVAAGIGLPMALLLALKLAPRVRAALRTRRAPAAPPEPS